MLEQSLLNDLQHFELIKEYAKLIFLVTSASSLFASAGAANAGSALSKGMIMLLTKSISPPKHKWMNFTR
jgi:hypothetical protein